MKRIALSLGVLLALASCGWHSVPPGGSTPAPPPLEGTFICGDDTLFFSGKERGVRWHLAQAPDPLPSRGEGICVFLYHNEEYRYDFAEYFRLRDTQGRQYTFIISSRPSTPDKLTIFCDIWSGEKAFIKKTQL